MGKIKQILIRVYLAFINIYKNARATHALKKLAKKTHDKTKPMKVGFIVFEPETWDKLDAVYKELNKRNNVETKLIVVPSFDRELKVTKEYGKELDFFRSIDPDAIMACNKDHEWIDISNDGYDYIFYQDPYNDHVPEILNSDKMVNYTKICYIPYGYDGSKVFYENNTHVSFFRNVYCEFVDIKDTMDILNAKFKKNVKKGYQRFINLGYPALISTVSQDDTSNPETILWTPRWSYHPVIGGSHFIEYKDGFISLSDQYPNQRFCIRPHPMMFRNLINEGRLDKNEEERFKKRLQEKGITLSIGNDLKTDFQDAKILITDYSSIISSFFMSNRPIIYCESHIPLNKEYQELAEGMYKVREWNQVEEVLKELLNGNDYLRPKREKLIKKIYEENKDAAERIANFIVEDYQKTANPDG